MWSDAIKVVKPKEKAEYFQPNVARGGGNARAPVVDQAAMERQKPIAEQPNLGLSSNEPMPRLRKT